MGPLQGLITAGMTILVIFVIITVIKLCVSSYGITAEDTLKVINEIYSWVKKIGLNGFRYVLVSFLAGFTLLSMYVSVRLYKTKDL
jgi:hypothetical protein